MIEDKMRGEGLEPNPFDLDAAKKLWHVVVSIVHSENFLFGNIINLSSWSIIPSERSKWKKIV